MKKKKSKKKTSFISKTAMTVLTIILIILFFCIMSMVEKIQGTARVVNYAGLVRGKTQRIIKLEDAGEPQDTMIADITLISTVCRTEAASWIWCAWMTGIFRIR